MGVGGSKHEMREFRDKVVIVTGGSRGIGLEFAKLAAAEGAKVAIIARDQGRIGVCVCVCCVAVGVCAIEHVQAAVP